MFSLWVGNEAQSTNIKFLYDYNGWFKNEKEIKSNLQQIPREVLSLLFHVHGAEVCLLLAGFHQKKCKITRILMHMFNHEITPLSRPYNQPGMLPVIQIIPVVKLHSMVLLEFCLAGRHECRNFCIVHVLR